MCGAGERGAVAVLMTAGEDIDRAICVLREHIQMYLVGRSGTWLASFAKVVAIAVDSGAPVGNLAAHVTHLLGPDAVGEVHEDEDREALVDALAGRWASITADDPDTVLTSAALRLTR